jgi:hypothetical protein
MAKQQKASKKRSASSNFEGVYLLKLVLYLIIGTMWIKISNGSDLSIPLPIGLAVGLLFTAHEHFRLDRKIEYAVLLAAMLVGYFAPFGLYIRL